MFFIVNSITQCRRLIFKCRHGNKQLGLVLKKREKKANKKKYTFHFPNKTENILFVIILQKANANKIKCYGLPKYIKHSYSNITTFKIMN